MIKCPSDLAISADNRYWVVDGAGGKLLAFSRDGSNPQQILINGLNVDVDVSILYRSDTMLVMQDTKIYGLKPNGDCLGVIGVCPFLNKMFQGALSPNGLWYKVTTMLTIYEYKS